MAGALTKLRYDTPWEYPVVRREVVEAPDQSAAGVEIQPLASVGPGLIVVGVGAAIGLLAALPAAGRPALRGAVHLDDPVAGRGSETIRVLVVRTQYVEGLLADLWIGSHLFEQRPALETHRMVRLAGGKVGVR